MKDQPAAIVCFRWIPEQTEYSNGANADKQAQPHGGKAQMRIPIGALATFAVFAWIPSSARAQTQQARAGAAEEQRPAFEVASFRRTGPITMRLMAGQTVAAPFRGFAYTPGKVICKLSLQDILREAYQMRSWQIQGPGWLNREYYELAATMPEATSRAEARRMLQTLLIQRLGLQVRVEKKAANVLLLVPGPKGILFSEGSKEPGIKHTSVSSVESLEITHLSMADLAGWLSDRAGKPVLDRTKLEGLYSVSFRWRQANPADESDVQESLESAVQRQLGLKLEARKEPVEYLIVDKVELNPAEN